MGPVSVYRVGAVGTDPSHVFGGEARDSDLCHAAWLGWLPLTLVEFAGPDVALVGDTSGDAQRDVRQSASTLSVIGATNTGPS